MHIEEIGKSSTDGARAECGTTRQGIVVSCLHSSLRPVFWSGVAVTLALGGCEFYAPGKRQPQPRKAIHMPETANDEYSLEIAARVGDTPIYGSLGDSSRHENCQSAGTPSIGVDGPRTAAFRKGRLIYATLPG